MKIFILNPILEVSKERNDERKKYLEEISLVAAADVELHSEGLEHGSSTIESFYDEYVGISDMVDKAFSAQVKGFDAVVINCFMNPGLEGMREILDIPIVGAGEAALYIASMLGDNFSILDPDPAPRTYSHKIVAALGLTHKLKSVKYMNLGVAGLKNDFNSVLSTMIALSDEAVNKDGAHVIVLGCTGMRRYAEELSKKLKPFGVPVVEPLTTAINVASALVRLRLTHSKLSFPKPSEKKRSVQVGI